MGLIFNEPWTDVLIIIAIVLVGLYILKALFTVYAKSSYFKRLKHPSTPLDVDGFVDIARNAPGYIKIWFLCKVSFGDRKANEETVKLSSAESTHVPGLQVTERAEARKGSKIQSTFDAKPLVFSPDKPHPLVIGTIRMGFGHHRIAYAACSWAMHADEDSGSTPTKKSNESRTTYFHDLLNIVSQVKLSRLLCYCYC